MKSDLVYAEVGCGLLDLSTLANERERAFAKLEWVRAWHVGERFMKAIGKPPEWRPNVGQVI